MRLLSDVLQSTSDCLFPVELGAHVVMINSVNSEGDTPLHVLLWRNDTDGALMLIQHHANVNAIGEMGETPLHVAIRQKNLIAIQAMLAVGARIDIVSRFGQSALDLASAKGLTHCLTNPSSGTR